MPALLCVLRRQAFPSLCPAVPVSWRWAHTPEQTASSRAESSNRGNYPLVWPPLPLSFTPAELNADFSQGFCSVSFSLPCIVSFLFGWLWFGSKDSRNLSSFSELDVDKLIALVVYIMGNNDICKMWHLDYCDMDAKCFFLKQCFIIIKKCKKEYSSYY